MDTTKRHVQRRTVLLTIAIIASIWFCISANAQNKPKSSGVKYAVLFVSPGPNGKQVHVSRNTNGNGQKTLHKDKSAYNAIKWAIKRGRTTAILSGEYQLSNPIDIRRDRRTLIVAPDATLKHKSDKEGFPLVGVIEVVRANNCRLFSFGPLIQTGTRQEGVVFKGQGPDGRSGIKGGLLFGTSKFRNLGSGYSLIDTEGVDAPVIVGANFGQSLLIGEGAYNTDVGILSGLTISPREGRSNLEGELLDLNGHNRNITFDTVLGTAPSVADEVVDINNSHNVSINRFLVFYGTNRKGDLAVGLDLYPDPGAHTHRQKKEGGWLRENKHVAVRRTERINKPVADFRKEVSLPGFPSSLPTLKVKVNLSVEYEDGTTRTLIKKRFRFDLDGS